MSDATANGSLGEQGAWYKRFFSAEDQQRRDSAKYSEEEYVPPVWLPFDVRSYYYEFQDRTPENDYATERQFLSVEVTTFHHIEHLFDKDGRWEIACAGTSGVTFFVNCSTYAANTNHACVPAENEELTFTAGFWVGDVYTQDYAELQELLDYGLYDGPPLQTVSNSQGLREDRLADVIEMAWV